MAILRISQVLPFSGYGILMQIYALNRTFIFWHGARFPTSRSPVFEDCGCEGVVFTPYAFQIAPTKTLHYNPRNDLSGDNDILDRVHENVWTPNASNVSRGVFVSPYSIFNFM